MEAQLKQSLDPAAGRDQDIFFPKMTHCSVPPAKPERVKYVIKGFVF